MKERIKVKLKVDLTQYLKGLVAGTEGFTIGNYGIWSRGNDNFTGVHFPDVGSLDVLWSSLEIIDEEYLEEAEKRRKQKLEEYKTARDIVKYVGPRGGFKGLRFVYTDANGITVSNSIGFKDEADKLIKYFEELKLQITEKLMK
ncbi:hypothetical protein [Paenibacillus sp. N3.4]|uniref:hypothetical protein n=1 Tax=Paenibacillus sp. N3.4 TaxID=2603222 RepID=UPI0011C70D6C|nr:hypothetical protein [Paenibacillus sp. N3.4]TXK80671.1 hypothetical protein FU659_17775 [Paenibacillus sp. N3.4]